MNILISIPKEVYKGIIGEGNYSTDFNLIKAFQNGTPIPDNATNGDVIKAFYPDLVVGSNNLGKTIFLRPNATVVIEDRMSDWWNAPYQKGGK